MTAEPMQLCSETCAIMAVISIVRHVHGSAIRQPVCVGYPQGLILRELAEYVLSDAVQKLLSTWSFGALPAKVCHRSAHGSPFVRQMSRASSLFFRYSVWPEPWVYPYLYCFSFLTSRHFASRCQHIASMQGALLDGWEV